MSVRNFTLAAGALLLAGWAMPRPVPRAMSYIAKMSGTMETPANTVKGTGTATFTLDGTKLSYKVEIHDLSGAPTAAHIHVGASGMAGPPVYSFAIKPGSGMSGIIAEGTLDLKGNASAGVTGDSLKTLLNNGNAYVNVHSKNFPNGEIRGQVVMKM